MEDVGEGQNGWSGLRKTCRGRNCEIESWATSYIILKAMIKSLSFILGVMASLGKFLA